MLLSDERIRKMIVGEKKTIEMLQNEIASKEQTIRNLESILKQREQGESDG